MKNLGWFYYDPNICLVPLPLKKATTNSISTPLLLFLHNSFTQWLIINKKTQI